jgi:phosphonate transport system permease protein
VGSSSKEFFRQAPLILDSKFQDWKFLEWKKSIAGQRGKQAVIALVLVLLVALTSWRCNVDVQSFITGINKGIPLVGMFFPPEWSGMAGMLQPLGVTTVMAMVATILGMCLSLPCALAASSNIAPPAVRHVMRAFIALERGLPEIVQMLLLIAIFGLGAVPGLVALSFSSIGMLAKLLADAIEEIEPQMLEAVAGTGATRSQVIRYAVIPQILPALFANGLFRFEFNVRAGVILGAVGAGGIGYVMSTAMNSMDYQRACMATLLTLALVFSTERVSDFFRARILGGGLLR